MKTKIIIGATAAVIVAGGSVALLNAGPLVGRLRSPMPIVMQVQQGHTLGEFTITPTLIVAGTNQPVVATMRITDSTVISNGVSLIYSRPTSQGISTVGILHDDGKNGDPIAGDGVFSLMFSLSTLQPGEVDFQITAAFRGTLTRVKSPPVAFNIDVPQDMTGFQRITASDNSFSIAVPLAWNLSMIETSNPDPATTRQIDFSFPDGTTPFTVSQYTLAQWQDLNATSGIVPTIIGQSNTYVFALEESDDDVGVGGHSDAEIRSILPTIYSTFRPN